MIFLVPVKPMPLQQRRLQRLPPRRRRPRRNRQKQTKTGRFAQFRRQIRRLPPWFRTNRPRPNRPSLPRNKLARSTNRSSVIQKNRVTALNVGWPLRDQNRVGAEIPSPQLYSARAPIHPKRPYGFDPSGCPPGRVFHFGALFNERKLPESFRVVQYGANAAGQRKNFSTT